MVLHPDRNQLPGDGAFADRFLEQLRPHVLIYQCERPQYLIDIHFAPKRYKKFQVADGLSKAKPQVLNAVLVVSSRDSINRSAGGPLDRYHPSQLKTRVIQKHGTKILGKQRKHNEAAPASLQQLPSRRNGYLLVTTVDWCHALDLHVQIRYDVPIAVSLRCLLWVRLLKKWDQSVQGDSVVLPE